MLHYIAASFENTFGIGQSGALKKEETNPLWVDGDREDSIGGSLGGAEADSQGVVVVVDELERGGVANAHF